MGVSIAVSGYDLASTNIIAEQGVTLNGVASRTYYFNIKNAENFLN